MTVRYGRSFWLGCAALAALQGCAYSLGQTADEVEGVPAYAQLSGLPQLPETPVAEMPAKKEPPKKATRPRAKTSTQVANLQPPAKDAPPVDKEQQSQPQPQPEMEIMNLIGLDEHQLMALLGAPTEQEEPTPARIWRYRRSACTIDVALYPDVATRTYRSLAYEVTSDDNTPEGKRACISQRHVYAGGQ